MIVSTASLLLDATERPESWGEYVKLLQRCLVNNCNGLRGCQDPQTVASSTTDNSAGVTGYIRVVLLALFACVLLGTHI